MIEDGNNISAQIIIVFAPLRAKRKAERTCEDGRFFVWI